MLPETPLTKAKSLSRKILKNSQDARSLAVQIKSYVKFADRRGGSMPVCQQCTICALGFGAFPPAPNMH
eukprot:6101644-Alexandrium_andersonii.AAC.1